MAATDFELICLMNGNMINVLFTLNSRATWKFTEAMEQLKRNREKKDGIKLRTAEKVFSGEREDENVELSELYHQAGSLSRRIFFL